MLLRPRRTRTRGKHRKAEPSAKQQYEWLHSLLVCHRFDDSLYFSIFLRLYLSLLCLVLSDCRLAAGNPAENWGNSNSKHDKPQGSHLTNNNNTSLSYLFLFVVQLLRSSVQSVGFFVYFLLQWCLFHCLKLISSRLQSHRKWFPELAESFKVSQPFLLVSQC